MNAPELNTELSKIMQRAFNEGVVQGKLDFSTIIGTLEMHKADIIRYAQDVARAAMAKELASKIQPATMLPPGRNGH